MILVYGAYVYCVMFSTSKLDHIYNCRHVLTFGNYTLRYQLSLVSKNVIGFLNFIE